MIATSIRTSSSIISSVLIQNAKCGFVSNVKLSGQIVKRSSVFFVKKLEILAQFVVFHKQMYHKTNSSYNINKYCAFDQSVFSNSHFFFQNKKKHHEFYITISQALQTMYISSTTNSRKKYRKSHCLSFLELHIILQIFGDYYIYRTRTNYCTLFIYPCELSSIRAPTF